MFVFELDALVLREDVRDRLPMLFILFAPPLTLDRTLSGAIGGCGVLFLFLLLDVLDGVATGCGLSPPRPSSVRVYDVGVGACASGCVFA